MRTQTQSSTLMQDLGALETGDALRHLNDAALEATAGTLWAGPTSVAGGCPLPPTINAPGCRFHIDTATDDAALEAAAEQWANPSGPPCFVRTAPPHCLPKHIDDDRPN